MVATSASTSATSVTSFGARPLVGSSMSSTDMSLSRTRASETICCWPRRASALLGGDEVGESVPTMGLHAAVGIDQAQVLVHGQAPKTSGPRGRSRCRE